jgi:hypothetical protein
MAVMKAKTWMLVVVCALGLVAASGEQPGRGGAFVRA